MTISDFDAIIMNQHAISNRVAIQQVPVTTWHQTNTSYSFQNKYWNQNTSKIYVFDETLVVVVVIAVAIFDVIQKYSTYCIIKKGAPQ